MSNIEHVKRDSILDKIKDIEKAGILHIKGYTYSEISSFLSITTNEAKSYIEEYKKIIQRQADKDPYFLERIQFNTVKALQEFDQISKEAWETVSIATDHGMVAQRIQALKLASDIATKKAQLHKLMSGGNNADAEYIQRMQKAESVNGILSRVLRDVISNHPQIADEVRKELAIAFEIMNGGEEEVVDDDIIDADIPPAPNV
jgi:hypothetical protein